MERSILFGHSIALLFRSSQDFLKLCKINAI